MDFSPAQVARGKASLERNSKEGEDGHRWWTGGILGEYGRIKFQGRHRASHRLAYQLPVDPFRFLECPYVRHLCGKSLCIEPTHLTLGTANENEMDKIKHGKSNHGKNAKISIETARAIKNSKGQSSKKDRAERFDVNVHLVKAIDAGRVWAWLGKHPRDDDKNITSGNRAKKRKNDEPLSENDQKRARTYICERATNPRRGTVCAIWNKKMSKGYGVATFASREYGAHRLSYCAFNNIGLIPEGIIVRHKCMNKACVSPWHLELGTAAENAANRGETSKSAKITEATARAIISSKGEGTQKQRAKRFGTTKDTVESIDARKAWKHLHE